MAAMFEHRRLWQREACLQCFRQVTGSMEQRAAGDRYRYTIPASGRADSYLMGYLANPNYKANIFYGWVSWKF